MPEFRVFIRDGDKNRVDQLTDWHHLEFEPTFNGKGAWLLELDSGSLSAPLLAKDGGIAITRIVDGTEATIFSGSVSTEWGWTATTFVAAGFSDEEILEEPAHPTPSLAEPPFPDDYDVRTGVASTIFIQAVNANFGSAAPAGRAVAGLVMAADPLLGTSLTYRANLDPMISLLRTYALTPAATGLGFRVLQSDSVSGQIVFSVYQPVDRRYDAKFGTEIGSARDFEDIWSVGQPNAFYILAGDGFGANRTILFGQDDAAVAAAGRRISRVIDKRGVTDTGELEQALAEAIAGSVASRRVNINPFDILSLEYGADYDLGDLVTFVIRGEEFTDLIRSVHVSLDPDQGAVITPMVGQAGASNDEQTAQYIATVQDRLSNVERNWRVPDSSVTRDMLVPSERWSAGNIRLSVAAAPATGWLFCQGQSMLRSAYPALFTALGGVASPWGLPDGTHFNVPDMRNRFPIGAGTIAVGATGGSTTANIQHTHTINDHSHTIPSHTHPVGDHSHTIPNHNHTYDLSHDHPNQTSAAAASAEAPNTINHGTTIDTTVVNPANHTHPVNLAAFSLPGQATGNQSSGGSQTNDKTGMVTSANTLALATDDKTGMVTTLGGSTTLSITPPFAGIQFEIYTGA